jgi:DUF1680 family protein
MRRSGGAEVLEGAAASRRANWFAVSCCPPNLMRFLATFPDQVATVDDGGVQIHQFVTGSIDAPVGGRRVGLVTKTRYPWEGDVEVSIAQTPADPWRLSIRVPQWCSHATASVDGAAIVSQSGPGTVELTRVWRSGDRVVLHLEMPPQVTRPDPRIDAVRGSIALERGPLVYAVEDADLPAGKSVESLEVDPTPQVSVATESEESLGQMARLRLRAAIREDPEPASWPYRSVATGSTADAAPKTISAEVHAVPYFAWGNRTGRGMRVWLPARHGEYDKSVGNEDGQ